MTQTLTQLGLRELLEDPVPAIAVSFSDDIVDGEIADAVKAGLDVFELRIDRFSNVESSAVLETIRRFAGTPTIATIRAPSEGGEWNGGDDQRLALFEQIIPEVSGVDIELSSQAILPEVVEAARAQGKVVIVSNHNFNETLPVGEIEAMALEAKAAGADYVKLSSYAHSFDDTRALADLTMRNAELGLIVIAMGPHGTASRVFFPALGSRLTYAYARSHPVPGQLNFKETFEELRLFYPEFNARKVEQCELLEDA